MKKLPLFFIFLFSFSFCFIGLVLAQTPEEKLVQLQEEYARLQKEYEVENKKEKDLETQLKQMDLQIKMTSLKISQTVNQIEILEGQIEELSRKIGILDTSLDEVSLIFINRVSETYKAGKYTFLDLFFSSSNFSNFFSKMKYLRMAQINDRKLLLTMEELRLNFDNQKKEKEEKQTELESLRKQLALQKVSLDQQKKDKQYLLQITQNNKRKYQEMMARALAELQAIQGIIAGRGEEKEIGSVSEGEKIASIIVGISPCSTGTHLHFEVREGESAVNPAGFLKPIDIIWDNLPDGQFSFSGSWRWPVDSPVRITQGFGDTFYARVRKYYGGNPHTGIDILNDNNMAVYSVSSGTLFNGSIKCGSGYLRYVRVKHKDSNLSTYYLHVNYEKV